MEGGFLYSGVVLMMNIAELCRVLHLVFVMQHFEKTLVDSCRILLLFEE